MAASGGSAYYCVQYVSFDQIHKDQAANPTEGKHSARARNTRADLEELLMEHLRSPRCSTGTDATPALVA